MELNKPKFIRDNDTFLAIYGRNLLAELDIILPDNYLIVTMEDLWEKYKHNFKNKQKSVYIVKGLDIDKVNEDLAEDLELSDSQIKRFLILHKELDADDGELTRTNKVRRNLISERYGKLVDALYSNEDHCFIETEVTFEDGRKGSISADLKIQDMKIIDLKDKVA